MEKCRRLYQFSWCHFGEMTQHWWERVSFCWCACEEKVRKRLMLSGLVHAPPQQHGMLDPSTLDVPLCSSHSVLPSAPAGQHTWCAQNNRLNCLFQFGTTGCSTQEHPHLIVTPKQPWLTSFASAVTTSAISWPSFLLPLYLFSPLQSPPQ